MKIVYMTDIFLPVVGGVVTAIVNFTTHLADRGNQVHLFTTRVKSEKPFSWHYKNTEVTFLPSIPFIFYPKFYNTSPFSPEYWQIRKQIVEFKPDIIHVHGPDVLGFTGLTIANSLHIPIIATFHGYWMESEYLKIINMERFSRPLSALGWSYSNLLYTHVDHIITPTQSVKERLIEEGIEVPIDVVSNGVDTSLKEARPFRLKLPEKYFIYAGRISAEKSLEITIQAFKAFTEKNDDTDLVIAGDGPLIESFKDTVKNLGIENRVHFLGELTHEEVVTTTLLKDAVACVTASKSETQCLSILEAMVWGTPAILPRANALADVGDENCIMCEPDNVAQFTDAYLRMSSPKEREHYSKRALDFAQSNSLEKSIDELEHLYKEVIAKKTTTSL